MHKKKEQFRVHVIAFLVERKEYIRSLLNFYHRKIIFTKALKIIDAILNAINSPCSHFSLTLRPSSLEKSNYYARTSRIRTSIRFNGSRIVCDMLHILSILASSLPGLPHTSNVPSIYSEMTPGTFRVHVSEGTL